MNTTINELFNIRNKGIKKAYIKRIGIKKLGIWGIIFLFGTATFISGFSINSYAASSSTVLPIARGGTGANEFASGHALIGNDSNSLTTKAIDTTPTVNSSNLITSGAVKTVSNNADIGKGIKNQYFITTVSDIGTQEILVLGQVPTDETRRIYQGVTFMGEIAYQRCLPHIGSCVANLDRFTLDFVLGGRPQEVTADRVHMKCISRDSCGYRYPIMKIGTFLYNENMYVGLYPQTPVSQGYGQNLYISSWIINIGVCADFTCPSQKVLFSDVTDWTVLKQLV
ncbi:MAG: hypothetical protein LBT91_03430 [Bifidobacteriaceae bacterium]|jgi:hypothetical protein|nr:hypothetical protein [Bifidobacteriaceae bacterium]